MILESARAVFVADPSAPIAAVAEHAGVGISALYRRYASKDELLRQLNRESLADYIADVEAALADERDPGEAFADFMRRRVDADSHSLTLRPRRHLHTNRGSLSRGTARTGTQRSPLRADPGSGRHPSRSGRRRPLGRIRVVMAGLSRPLADGRADDDDPEAGAEQVR